MFALFALLVAACGREAVPRAALPTSPANAGQEASGPTMARAPTPDGAQPEPAANAQVAGDPRAQGDPNAPITVIEYGDYQ